MSESRKYSYPSTNPQLIADLKLVRHPEGGYYAETDRQTHEVPTPFVDGRPGRSLATEIFYFLSHDEPEGVFHMNKSITYHVLHQGRAEYTLIKPSSPPIITRVTLGTDTSAGEVRQLLVPTNIWKMSRIPPSDLESCKTQEEKDKTGCLITEVVVPGFHWEDHKYMTEANLREMFEGVEGGEEKVASIMSFVKKAE